MYPTWLKRTTRTWTAALLILATVSAVIGGVQNVAAQQAAPAATNRPTRLLLPLMLNRAASAAEPVVAFAAEASPTGATVTTDLADYPPGAIVTVTGAGWASGEAVDIFVNDSGGQTWSLHSDPDPVADLAGAFMYQFQLPTWFVANYAVLATGTSSGSATTTFTDVSIGIVRSVLKRPGHRLSLWRHGLPLDQRQPPAQQLDIHRGRRHRAARVAHRLHAWQHAHRHLQVWHDEGRQACLRLPDHLELVRRTGSL